MKVAMLIVLLSTAEVSPVGCDALADSAENAFETFTDVIAKMTSEKMLKVLPHLPTGGREAAEAMIAAQQEALAPLMRYTDTLKAFAEEMRRCAE